MGEESEEVGVGALPSLPLTPPFFFFLTPMVFLQTIFLIPLILKNYLFI